MLTFTLTHQFGRHRWAGQLPKYLCVFVLSCFSPILHVGSDAGGTGGGGRRWRRPLGQVAGHDCLPAGTADAAFDTVAASHLNGHRKTGAWLSSCTDA